MPSEISLFYGELFTNGTSATIPRLLMSASAVYLNDNGEWRTTASALVFPNSVQQLPSAVRTELLTNLMVETLEYLAGLR